jgi:Methyltransferase domain
MTSNRSLPGESLNTAKMPGHWLLARLGKRVLRPGGLELTRCMLNSLALQPEDDVIEFAPGLGVTTRLTLARNPHSYVGVERDEIAAGTVRRYLRDRRQRCIVASAEDTGLADAQASVVYGEAMLTMQGERQKAAIISEAARLLRAGGQYGIHELCLVPDDIPQERRDLLEHDLSATIHVGARPLTVSEWRTLLTDHGFSTRLCVTAPMHLLEAPRLIQDEGLFRTLLIASRLLRDKDARSRVLAMRTVFRRYSAHLRAIVITARKHAST